MHFEDGRISQFCGLHILTGAAGEGTAQVQPPTPASPPSLTAPVAQSSLALPQSPVKPL